MRCPDRYRVRKFALVLLLAGLAAWIVPSYFSAERYRRRLQAGLEQTLHRPVKFGALSFHLLPRPGFSIENAEVDEDPAFGPEPFARVESIDCELRWHSLWRKRMDFAYLHLDRPSLNIVLNAHGNWNVEKLLLQSGVTSPATPATGKAPRAMEQLDLKVDGARINFQVGPNKKPFALTDVDARLEVNPAQRQVQFELTASPLRSDLGVPTPGPVEVRGTWTPGADLQGPLDMRINTRGALLYDWIPVVTGKNPQVYGVIDSNVHLSGSLPALLMEGETRLSQLHRWDELPPSDPMPLTLRYRGRLLRAHERLQIESLEASFADSQLHLSGTVDKVISDPQLDLVVALEHSRLEDVVAVSRRLWPNLGAWNIKGRVDAMLAIQGAWKQRRYGGFLGAQQVVLESPSGSFPLSDIALRIDRRGINLAPLQIILAPRVVLTVDGNIHRAKPDSRYEVELSAKAIPLHQAVLFGRGLGLRAFQRIDATGSATAVIRLAGPAWPPARPLLTARADLRAARVLIPGLTEPLNVPRASLFIDRDQIIADPVVAVIGTSVFKGRLAHQGPRLEPWHFDVQANNLRLEQAALWFTALGLRPSPDLLERLPGLASFAAQRSAASQLFGSLNAQGRFSTPDLSYRGVTLNAFSGTFDLAGRTIRMQAAKFRSYGGTGSAEGAVDFINSPPLISAQWSLAHLPLQALTARFPALHGLRGTVNAAGSFGARGLARDEVAASLAGNFALQFKDVSLGDLDPVGTIVRQAGWGKLEPERVPGILPALTVNVQLLDRHIVLKKTLSLDLNGANLQVDGACTWTGAADLMVRADLSRLHRRWLEREDEFQPALGLADIHLAGPLDRLVVNPRPQEVRAGRGSGAFAVR